MTPTEAHTAPKRSGRCAMQAATSSPPLEPPPMASFCGSRISVGNQPFRGSNEIVKHILLSFSCAGLVPFLPVFAAAPKQATAKIPPSSIQARALTLNAGVMEILNPP